MNGQSVSSKQTRVEYIDLFRAFGIILMIMGHVKFGSCFDKWIHAFHMPMFFVISGFFFKQQNIDLLIKKRAKSLLLPYLVFGLFHSLIYFLQIGRVDLHSFNLLFWENTSGSGIPIAGALWFLPALFISDILFTLIQGMSVNCGWKTLISAIVAVIGMACATYLPFRLPWAMDAGFVGVGMFQVGFLIKTKFNIAINLNLFFTAVAVIAFSASSIYLNGNINLRTGTYANWLLFWVNAIGMTVSLWNLSRILYEAIGEKTIFDRILKEICCIGRDSIVFLCLNQLSILAVRKAMSYLGIARGVLMVALRQISTLLIVLALLFIVRAVICNTKLKVIMGK